MKISFHKTWLNVAIGENAKPFRIYILPILVMPPKMHTQKKPEKKGSKKMKERPRLK